jgi:hypothetical protein
MNSVLLSAGVASVILAVVGGGAQAFGVKVPVLDSLVRQAALGLVGIAFLVLAFAVGEGGGGGGSDDHRKAREIQSSLVQDVRQAVNHVMLTGESLATRTANGNVVFIAARDRWGSDSAKIATRLETYFPKAKLEGKPVPSAWRNFSQAVENLYFLSATELPFPTRCHRTKELMAYLRVSAANLKCPKKWWTTCSSSQCRALASKQWGDACYRSRSWNALALCDEDSMKSGGEGYQRRQNYFRAYETAMSKLRTPEDRLLKVLRSTTPAGF